MTPRVTRGVMQSEVSWPEVLVFSTIVIFYYFFSHSRDYEVTLCRTCGTSQRRSVLLNVCQQNCDMLNVRRTGGGSWGGREGKGKRGRGLEGDAWGDLVYYSDYTWRVYTVRRQ